MHFEIYVLEINLILNISSISFSFLQYYPSFIKNTIFSSLLVNYKLAQYNLGECLNYGVLYHMSFLCKAFVTVVLHTVFHQ